MSSIEKNASGLYEVKVDEHVYEFEKWGADESLDVLLDIIPLISKPLGTGIAAVLGADGDGGLLDKKFDPQMVNLVFESLTTNFKKEVVKELLVKLCSKTVLCDGKKIIFRTHYQDKLGHLFKVAKAALEVQYGNFFDALLEIMPVSKPSGMSNRNLAESAGSSGDQ